MSAGTPSQGHFDTIAAPITGLHRAAVAVVRVSGPEAWLAASQVFTPWPVEPEPWKAIYGRMSHGDDGIALPFAEGKSYTGEPSVEFSVHGSLASVRELLEALYKAGVRPAEPGEFTLRAFLNGRIDLTQAEGVRDTVEALTDAQFRAASQLREGRLRQAVSALRSELEGVLAAVEASTDFSEEIGDLDRGKAVQTLSGVADELNRLLQTADTGRIVREGVTIAIVGLPNAGKSSLLNALLGIERAIVTPIPGTTRDTVEEMVDLSGVPCRLIDTAGLRTAGDEIEQIGIERTQKAASSADLVLYVFDAAMGWSVEDEAAVASFERPFEVVANKCDLAASERGVSVSALSGLGLDQLVAQIQSRSGLSVAADGTMINRRHQPLLGAAYTMVAGVIETMNSQVPDDLASVGLRSAIMKLGEITGETAAPDVIDRIFHDFCIGK